MDGDLFSLASLLTAVRAEELAMNRRRTALVEPVRDVSVRLAFHKRSLKSEESTFNLH